MDEPQLRRVDGLSASGSYRCASALLEDMEQHDSISIWETREEAQKSAGMAAAWVKENLADRVRLLTTQIGDLALFRGLPVTA